ncbi:sulfatase-like hydrolase/transferase [bacterium]|nr:sulfatase-like hydrolase/transferase [bacterium]
MNCSKGILKEEKPNILWIITDEQRIDSLGCYGSLWAKTPNIDQLGREGIIFRNAITPAPVCVPARVSLLSGKYPSQTGIWWNHNGKDKRYIPHLTYFFKHLGYITASFGKQHYCSPNKAFEIEYHKEVNEDIVDWYSFNARYDESKLDIVRYNKGPFPWILGGIFPEKLDKTVEAEIIQSTIDWLKGYDKRQPFFLQVSLNAPHTPVVPPYSFYKLYENTDIRYPLEVETEKERLHPQWIEKDLKQFANASYLSREEIEKARRYYYAEVSFLDYEVGILLNWMKEKSLLDNTIVIFLSDHGTHLGDYGLLQKQTFYEPVVKVPFIVWYPSKFASGIEIVTPVETRWLLPSLLELFDINVLEDCKSESLADTFCLGIEPPQKPIFSEFTLGSFGIRENDKLIMLINKEWKFFVCVTSEISDCCLFNMNEDPYELTNLYYIEDYKDVILESLSLVEQHLLCL